MKPGESGSEWVEEKVMSDDSSDKPSKQRSVAEILKEARDVWRALPVAALVIAWHSQPATAFADAGDLAKSGFVMALSVIVGWAAILTKKRKNLIIAYFFFAFALVMSHLVINRGIEADKHIQKRCSDLGLEKAMLSATPEGKHALEVFQALRCRPIGVSPAVLPG